MSLKGGGVRCRDRGHVSTRTAPGQTPSCQEVSVMAPLVRQVRWTRRRKTGALRSVLARK